MTSTLNTSRSTSPGELREFGKNAADLSLSTGIGMTEAVVRTIGGIKLSSEQVHRVVEAANHAAFSTKYAATSGRTRSVHFDEGPADPTVVLERLKSAASATVKVAAALDYMAPPASAMKTASAEFTPAFETVAGVIRDVRGLQAKLAFAHEEAVSGAECARAEIQASFGELIKCASSALDQGASPDDLFDAWAGVSPELAKVAMSRLGLGLRGIKTAMVRINPEHGVVASFEAMVRATESYSAWDEARATIEVEQGKVAAWLQRKAAA